MKKPTRRKLPFSLRRLDRRAVDIVLTLQRAGHEAYLVGGCVRDHLAGATPKDYDIATSARPNQVRRLFRRSRVIGRRFRIVHVYSGREIYEVATFRREPPQARDGDPAVIRDDNVFGSADEDARRRDFTVNGLFLDPSAGEIVDWVGGLDDLDHGRILAIGDPDRRFQEDPVRILRLIKFIRRLDLDPGEAEIEAARRHAGLVRKSAEPRVIEEIFRLMDSGNMEGAFEDLLALDLVRIILPDLHAWMNTPERRSRQMSALRALDGWVVDRGNPGYGAKLALLYGPMVEDEFNPQTRTLKIKESSQVPSEVLRRLQARARLPRASISKATLILLAQGHMDPEGWPRRKRPWPAEKILEMDFFEDALEVLRCRLEAAERDPGLYDQWHEKALSFPKG